MYMYINVHTYIYIYIYIYNIVEYDVGCRHVTFKIVHLVQPFVNNLVNVKNIGLVFCGKGPHDSVMD